MLVPKPYVRLSIAYGSPLSSLLFLPKNRVASPIHMWVGSPAAKTTAPGVGILVFDEIRFLEVYLYVNAH